jgi:transposase
MLQIKDNIIGSDTLDHLGLVAATIDKLGISKYIDKLIPLTDGAITTMGQRVSAMILNGLGFIDDRLYLFPEFLKNKPVKKLFGEGICAAHFNDAALGRCLDEIHEYGETKLYSELALPIALKYKLLNKSAHFDTTTLTVYGEYEEDNIPQLVKDLATRAAVFQGENKPATQDSQESPTIPENSTPRDLELSQAVKPEYGYAKNKRSDLKQMTLLLATTGASGFPIWMESHSGNTSDKKSLEEAAQRMQKFCKALESAPDFLYIGDSAMYANCVKHGSNLLWLSRVPENMKLSAEFISQKDVNWTELNDGYKIYVCEQEYGGVKQRWALIYSSQAYEKEIITLEKNILKENTEASNMLWHMGNQVYGCIKDIEKEIKKISKKLKYHQIIYSTCEVKKHSKKGRPKKGEELAVVGYKIVASLQRNDTAIEYARLTKGRFILATNQFDKVALPDSEILPTYKEQSGTESGFKFIKDDAFEVDSIFLKKPSRISALMVIMTLCLMVYSYAQYFLRQELTRNKDTIRSQSGKDTMKPSQKWVYRMFQGIHVLRIKVGDIIQEIVLNLNDMLCKIIRYFGEVACRIYDVPLQ